MKKYLGVVKIKGHYIRTVVFADSDVHAKLLLAYQYGFDSLLNNPKLIQEEAPQQQPLPTVMMPPKANLRPSINLKQQKALVQQRKMRALVKQQADNELKRQAKVTQADIAKSLMILGDIKRANKP